MMHDVSVELLGGEWILSNKRRGIQIPAMVPGDVHSALLRAGEIADPFYRDNELQLQWVGESEWTYTRTFSLTKKLLAKKRILLRADGLDTFASITINGKVVGKTDNMFRSYEWNIKDLLVSGTNAIEITFSSPLPYIAKQQSLHPALTCFDFLVANPVWVRKEQCNFGWDWGPKLVTCGIWRDINIIAFDTARIFDVAITQEHGVRDAGGAARGKGKGARGQAKAESLKLQAEDGVRDWGRGKGKEAGERYGKGSVGLTVQLTADKLNRSTLIANVTVCLKGKVVASQVVTFRGKRTSVALTINTPELWWPNGMGKQPLYDVTVELQNKDKRTLDSQSKRIGLRTLELDRHADEWGESFQFVVNGVPFFAKGSNWVPGDAILSRMNQNKYRRLVENAVAANMNMLRVWGGGIYEDDAFYDICDELGICVWQDFMFACGAYPTFVRSFLPNVKAEARDAIKRLRHHACMALWCGNNELEMMGVSDEGWMSGHMPWKDYLALFDKLLPDQVAELSPDIPYWPSSPHSPHGDRRKHRNHLCGDAHLWILSGEYSFACGRGHEHRFASEFGFQSFPEPKTINTFTLDEDRNVSSRIMELHQRGPNGNIPIIQKILECFIMPTSFEGLTYVSQIVAGVGVKSVCEHFRRSMPRCMGALYWQLNDCWPVASWASIDYHGRWKAMHYMAQHFFAPMLISGVEDKEKGTVEVHITSDKLVSKSATISWVVTDVTGKRLFTGRKQVRTPVNASRRVHTLRLRKLLDKQGHHDLIVWLQMRVSGEELRRNMILFSPPKHLELSRQPGIKYALKLMADGLFDVTLTSKRVALWVWLELEDIDAKLSNNFFHLRPGMTERVTITPARKLTKKQISRKLLVRSVVDTYL